MQEVQQPREPELLLLGVEQWPVELRVPLEVDQSNEPALQRSELDDVVPLQVGQQPARLEQHRGQEGQRVVLEDSLLDLRLRWGESLRIRHN